MAERLAYLEAVVGADITQFRKGMRDVRNDVGILSETIGGIGKLGRTMTFAITAPLLALGSYAVQAASQFDAAMHNINAIAGLTGDELDILSAKTLEFGRNTRAGANEAANALYTVYSAGITNATDAFTTMRWATKTAEAGLADMTVTTEALVASLLSYGDVTEEFAERASDALTAMVAVGVGSMDEFAGAVGNVLPTASALGMSIEELYGDMAFLTQRGMGASKSATALNSALTSLAKPTNAMKAAFQTLGVVGAEGLIEKFGGVNGALQALIGTTDGTQASIQALFNNIRGARAINLFAKDIDGWNDSMAEFNTLLDGATMRAWEEQGKSFAAKWDLMTSALQGAAITIGTKLLPVIAPLIGGIADFFNEISSLNPELLTLGIVIAGVVAATGPLLWIFASLLNPVGLVLGSIIALGAAFAENFHNIRTVVSDAVTSVVGDLGWVKDVFTDLYTAIFPDTQTAEFTIAPVTIDTTDIISVTTPTSLYALFIEEGYDELFGWHEFMRVMEAAGWVGGALTPEDTFTIDLGDMITVEGFESPFSEMLHDSILDAQGQIEAGPGLWERLLGTWTDIEPIVTENLANIAGAIVSWADNMAGKGLNLIAAWFTPNAEGKSPITTMLTSVLEGDFAAAINQVIPGAGSDLQKAISSDWPAKIEAAIPDIVAGVTNLVGSLGTWLVDEGIPLFAEKAGYFIGKIGTIIVDGMGKLNDWLFGGGEGQGNAGDAASYVEDNVIDPFSTGFNQAMSEADVGGGMEGWADGIVALVAGALGTAFLVTAAFSGVTAAIGGALSLSLAAVKLTPFILMEALRGAFVVRQVGLTVMATGFVAKVTAAIATAGAAISAGAAWAVSTVASIGAAIAGLLTTATFVVPALGLTLGTLLYVAIPQSWKDTIRTAIGGFFDEVFGEGTMDWWDEATENNMLQVAADIAYFIDPGAADKINEARTNWVEALPATWDTSELGVPLFFSPEFMEAMPDIDFTMPLDRLIAQFDAFGDYDLGEQVQFWTPAKMADFEAGQQLFVGGIDGAVLAIDDADERMQAALERILTFGDDGLVIPSFPKPGEEGRAGGLGAGLFNTSEIEAAGEEAVTVIETEMTEMGIAFLAQMGAGTNLDAERINTDFLQPLEQSWLGTFGTDSPMYTTMSEFATDMALNLDSVGDAFARMWAGVAATVPFLVGMLVSEMPKAIGPLNAVRDAANAAAAAVNALLSISGTITIEVIGSTPDGTHATGLTYVPFDGYMAELHKGERVLTAAENEDYGNIPTGAVAPQGNTTNNSTTENTIIIQGVQDVDGMLRELERRGIKIAD